MGLVLLVLGVRGQVWLLQALGKHKGAGECPCGTPQSLETVPSNILNDVADAYSMLSRTNSRTSATRSHIHNTNGKNTLSISWVTVYKALGGITGEEDQE